MTNESEKQILRQAITLLLREDDPLDINPVDIEYQALYEYCYQLMRGRWFTVAQVEALFEEARKEQR